jgi:ubiquinone/menaquinone biosynthesis C-methylase UbiE
MFKVMLHRLAEHPVVYDLIQKLAGEAKSNAVIASQTKKINPKSLVVDFGGGTGSFQELLPQSSTYVCLDMDRLKLKGFLKKSQDGLALIGDATQAPIRAEVVDVAICKAILHHVPEENLAVLFQEISRVLKPCGKFIVIDPVWASGRWIGRQLWKYDRGAFPRTEETLHSAISPYYKIVYWQTFHVYHEYVLCVGVKNPGNVERNV